MKPDIENKFTKACREYSNALFRYCTFKISDKETAKDLIQETFMKAWIYLTKGKAIKNIRALFYKILSNLIIDHYKKKKTISLDALTEKNGLEDPAFDEKEHLEDKLDGEIALEALNQIPDKYKDVVFMRYVEDLSLPEIAEITKEPENTIAVKIHRGLKKVKFLFNKG